MQFHAAVQVRPLLLTLSVLIVLPLEPGGSAAAPQSTARPAQATSPFTIESLTSPAAIDTGEQRLTLDAGRPILSWIERSGTRASVKFAERMPTGWSTPRTVISGSNLVVNAADTPSVHAFRDRTLVAQWLQENGPDTEAYDLRVARSTDNGVTWTPLAPPHHDGTKTQHGFASLFEMTGGGFGLIWLDGRAGDEMALRATTYAADGKQREESLIDSRVCECCQTAAAVTADGPIVAFRDRSATEIRDIAVSRVSAGRWSAPLLVHQDRWEISGCPVNGPAIAAAGRNVAVAWFTAPTGQGRAFLAFSQDAGRTFGSPVRVDEVSALGRLQVVLLPDGSAAVTWVEVAGGRSQLRVRRVERNGSRSVAATIADGIGSQYPRLAQGQDELIFAWAENTRGTTRVRTARASLPNALRGRP